MKDMNHDASSNNFQYVGYPLKNQGNQSLKETDGTIMDVPLCIACAEGNLDLVKTLIDKGTDINKKDSSNLTPIMHAALNGNRILINLLVESGAKISYALLGIVKSRTNQVEKEVLSGNEDPYEVTLWQNLLDFLVQEGKKQ
jgi:ankyrin repeat protein